jgi:uncharacterized membrane protein
MPSFLRGRSLRLAVGLVALAYPFLVYFGLRLASPAALGVVLLAVLALRLVVDRQDSARRSFAPAFWIAAAVALLLVALSPLAGLQSYPILLSLGFAGLFGHSLWQPPTVIERIARLRDPNLPPSAVAYTRKVTAVWLGFFLANAAISTATAIGGSLELWTLYNGFISYVIMGVLFISEWILRGYLRVAHRDTA